MSRDIAVSNLTALIARDEYVLEESYSGEEEADDDAEEVTLLMMMMMMMMIVGKEDGDKEVGMLTFFPGGE